MRPDYNLPLFVFLAFFYFHVPVKTRSAQQAIFAWVVIPLSIAQDVLYAAVWPQLWDTTGEAEPLESHGRVFVRVVIYLEIASKLVLLVLMFMDRQQSGEARQDWNAAPVGFYYGELDPRQSDED
mmetsp:Transcript_1955/g.2951  ORF Transcript_1955/g.2951 Transcript_1955/m.2951 type:complete len:125 (+) Transcript_1955:3-377(+)